jgi:hypothetical protein
MICQHAVRGADKAITDAINKQFERREDDAGDGTADGLVPVGRSRANGP